MSPAPIGLRNHVSAATAATAALVLYGCAARPDSAGLGSSALPRPESTLVAAAPDLAGVYDPPATLVDARPAALVNGEPIRWGELKPALTDLAGAEALREAIIDRRLEQTAATADLVIGDADAERERDRLLTTLDDDPATAFRLLEELRDRERLGPARFRALLRRNAILRGLVRDQVTVDEASILAMHDAAHGPRRQVRILVAPDLTRAQSALARVQGGAFFGDLAVESSTDASAARGGLLEPVSRLDPTYPAALRHAIWSLQVPGETSNAILMENGYAIVQLVRERPGDGIPLESVRAEIARLARLRAERVGMDQLVRRILADTRITIYDDALAESWKRDQGRRD